MVNIGWDYLSHPIEQNEGEDFMLAALQFIVRNVLILSVIIGLTFMVFCTVFMIICVIQGDIKINIIRSKDEKENK